jgi:membrane associated rhomboid family serine protease
LLPIKDLNRTLTAPHVNRLLLIINILIFSVYMLSSLGIVFGNGVANFIGDHFIMLPTEILNGQRLYTLATSMFMHASWYHLLGNMIYLFVFGDNIEDIFGHLGYSIFYLISGVAASLVQIAATLYAPAISSLLGIAVPSDLTIGVLGASGAISAVLGAYIVLFPKAYVLTFIIIVIIPIPAVLFLGFWFVLQWLMGFFNVAGGVAIFAHTGGFIIGMIIALTIGLNRKKKLKTKLEPKK